jgi:OOP family OmpA-OmpF porin
MNKLSSIAALVSAALIAITTGTAWSDEATPIGSAAPAVQTPAPSRAVAPGRYPPPVRGGYAQPWQHPSHWSVPRRDYGQWSPHNTPRAQPRTAPAAPATAPAKAPAPATAKTPAPAAKEIPPSAELKQAQEQLAAKSTELDMAHAQLEQLRGTLQYSLAAEQALSEKLAQITGEHQDLQVQVTELTAALNTTTATLERHRQHITLAQEQNWTLSAERDRLHDELASRDVQLATMQDDLQAATQALEQTQSETSASWQQLSEARAQAEMSNNELSELNDELETRKNKLANAVHTGTTERDRLRSDVASRDVQLATVEAELQAATQALEQAQSETFAFEQQLSEASAQAEMFYNELGELKAELEARQTTLWDTQQTLDTVTAERDGLQADLAACSQELTQGQAALTTAQSAVEALHLARAAAAEAVVHPVPGGPDAVEPAAGAESDAGAADAAALQTATTDADADGVADGIDLCPETQQDQAVDSTGCAAGVAIKLEGVNFLNNSQELTDAARGILDRVAGVISQHPDLRLEVAGHTDATGDPSYNQSLSMQRAEAVRNYLVAQGVNPEHIGAAGYGGQRPIADNTTSEGLRKNRRVELRRLQ